MIKRFLLLLAVFFQVMINCISVPAAELQFSLSDAVKYALEKNDEILSAGLALESGKQDIGIAKSRRGPQLSFEESDMRTNNPGYVLSLKMDQHQFSAQDLAGAPYTFNQPEPINDFQSTLAFDQPLIARVADLGITMAQQEYTAQTADFQRKRQEIALEVVKNYLAVQTDFQYIKVNEKAVEDAQEHLRLAESRYQAGMGLYSDTLRAGTAVTDAEQRLVSAQKNFNVAKRQLGLTLGLEESAAIADSPLSLPTVKPIDFYNVSALHRPDIVALEMRYKNSQTNLEFAQAGYLPVLGISGAYQLNDPKQIFGAEGQSWQIMAYMRWNVFDGEKTSSEIKKAKLEQQAADEKLQSAKKSMLFKIYNAYLSVDEAGKNLELARASATSAEEGKRLVEKRYNVSLSPLVDLLDAQVNLDNARATLVAQENAYQLAIAVLNCESGNILKSLAVEK